MSNSAVFYRESEAQDAPIKRIDKNKILMIKYQDGRKEIMGETEHSSPQATEGNQSELPDYIVKLNEKSIESINNQQIIYKGADTDKDWSQLTAVMGITKGSIIETEDLAASFIMKKYVAEHSVGKGRLKQEKVIEINEYPDGPMETHMYQMVIVLKNKTNKTVYVDLANTFLMRNGEASAYYIPTASSTTTGTSSGGGVNLGAVAGAVGIGGAIGTLANGVNVGGGSMSQNTKTTFSQRIISIPPMSTKSLEPQSIGEGEIFDGKSWSIPHDIIESVIPALIKDGKVEQKKNYYVIKELKRGQKIDIVQSPDTPPLSAYVTYSHDESLSSTNSLNMGFYVRQLVGIGKIKNVDYSHCPFVFFYPKGTGRVR